MSSEHFDDAQVKERVKPRVESITSVLHALNDIHRGRLFKDAVVLTSARQPARQMGRMIAEELPMQHVTSERPYVAGDNPRAVKDLGEWLVRGTREELGEEWDGTPILGLVPSGAVDYMRGKYDPLAPLHDVGPLPVFEITEATWPTKQYSPEIEAKVLDEYAWSSVPALAGSLAVR